MKGEKIKDSRIRGLAFHWMFDVGRSMFDVHWVQRTKHRVKGSQGPRVQAINRSKWRAYSFRGYELIL